MTKPMPQTTTPAQNTNEGQIIQTYIPVLHGRYYLNCSGSNGLVWPCLNSSEWSKDPDRMIKIWRKTYGIRERKPKNGPKRECKTCTRPVCIYPAL